VIGPISSWANPERIKQFAARSGSRAGAICYHNYGYCHEPNTPVPTDATLLQSPTAAKDAVNVRSALAGTAAAEAPIFMGEYNMECSATPDARQQGIVGAVFAANWLISAHQTGAGVEMGAIWEMASDGTYGLIQQGDKGWNRIVPNGWLLAKAGALMGGQEVLSQFAQAGARRCLAVMDDHGRIAVMVVNSDASAALSGRVAITDWPLDGSWECGLTKWELSEKNPQGAVSTVRFSKGVTEPIRIPPTSVVILHNREPTP
jgi:hypothetical protein